MECEIKLLSVRRNTEFDDLSDTDFRNIVLFEVNKDPDVT